MQGTDVAAGRPSRPLDPNTLNLPAAPLQGSIPDMHAGSQEFLALQRLYRAKAEADAQQGRDRVRARPGLGRRGACTPVAPV